MANVTLKQLECVTLTGADESIRPRDLVPLTKEFEFVEWGILIGSGTGSRFPSIAWIHDLIEARVETGNRMQLSLHICGGYLREIAAGRSTLMDRIGPAICAFDRVQLNWHGEYQSPSVSHNVLDAFCRLAPWEPAIIFQLDGQNDHLCAEAMRRFRVAGLFDISHGAGVLPDEWASPRADMQCGWAGGLGPDNLAAELPKIEATAFGSYWVDMETKLRSYVPATTTTIDTDRFDLAKARKCLEIAREFWHSALAPKNG